jgi:site-specific DNA-methyltransferase (adenine-specific)
VPIQKWSKLWTDKELYSTYGISKNEIAFIEKIVRPIDLSGDSQGEAIPDDDE